MARGFDVGGPKSLGDLVRFRVSQMVGPEETVELDGIATPEIIQHPHRELQRSRQFPAACPGHESSPYGAREGFSQQPRLPPDRPASRGYTASPHRPKSHRPYAPHATTASPGTLPVWF